MKALSDEKILDSWHKNAAPWSLAVREGQIDSRRLVTDSAIVGAVEEYGRAYTRPSVLDIGCGEGWLARALVFPHPAELGKTVFRCWHEVAGNPRTSSP